MSRPDLFIVGGKRTAMAEYCGTPGFGLFKDVSATDLGGHAIKAALADAGVEPSAVDHVVMGNAMQTSVDAHYGARHAALKAGIPVEVPALTVNRICGSGIQSVIDAAYLLLNDEAAIAVGGGMENMSQAPFCVYGNEVRQGIRFGVQPKMTDFLFQGLHDTWCDSFMAQTAERAAKEHGVTRAEADAYALRSHQLGAKAAAAGRFDREIVPVKIKQGRSEVEVKRDDHVKPETTLEGLAKLRPAFGEGGIVTAGNASGIVDGAAALVVATGSKAKAANLKPLAKIVAWHTAGIRPDVMALGPVPAIQGLFKKTGLKAADVDLFEINEAFAPQVVACEKALGLDRERLNVNGGAVSLGHPLAASGTRILLTLALELKDRNLKRGIASACIGGGQGIAMLIERA
jgi:acetyl-CoA acyltransferase 2